MSDKRKQAIEYYLKGRARELPIEVKPVDPLRFPNLLRNIVKREAVEPKTSMWIKAKGRIGTYHFYGIL